MASIVPFMVHAFSHHFAYLVSAFLMPGSKTMKYRYMVLSKETLAANSLLVHMGVYASTIRLNVFLGSVMLTRSRVSFFSLSRMKSGRC